MKNTLLPLSLLLFLAAVLPAAIVSDVRAYLNRQDFPAAEKLIAEAKGSGPWTPELLEAHSWIARGHLAAKHYDEALSWAEKTRALCLAIMKRQALDREKHLPIAFGATIEVTGQALAAQGQRSEAVTYLEGQLKKYYATSIRTRVQKNLHLISLEGKPAPDLELREAIGPNKARPLSALKGKPLLLFFWAHWCGDCKQQGPVLETLAKEFGPRGLLFVGPTQRYGYVAGGEEATPAQEKPYIAEVFQKFYANIPGLQVPLSEENFKRYGASTTPTLVLVDKAGIVRLYHPGKMTEADLRAKIASLL
ncbi:MAG: hypothetical protein OHK0021_11030 [Bryobacter sp.]